MRKLWFILLLLFAFGCVSTGNQNLTSRIDALEQEVNRLKIMGLAGEAAATDRVWPFYGLSSGTNALNGIGVGDIGDNDIAIGSDSNGYTYIYYWDESFSNGGTCTSPSCILPSDLTSEDGAWATAAQFYVDAFVSSAADGEHFIDPSNSSAFPTGIAEGSITCRDDRDGCFVYDGSNWLPMRTAAYGSYTATGTIDSYYVWGGVVDNNGVPSSTNITLTLPSAVKYMWVTIARVDNDGSITVQEGSGDVIDGANDIVLDADGESVTLFAISTGTWVIVADSKAPTYN